MSAEKRSARTLGPKRGRAQGGYAAPDQAETEGKRPSVLTASKRDSERGAVVSGADGIEQTRAPGQSPGALVCRIHSTVFKVWGSKFIDTMLSDRLMNSVTSNSTTDTRSRRVNAHCTSDSAPGRMLREAVPES